MVKRQRTWKRKAKVERKSLKMWAEGAREDVLRPHIEAYTDALERGWRAERDYIQKVCNEYHAQISWRLADHEEPELPLPAYDPLAPPVVEQLTAEEERVRHERLQTLNKRIQRWLKYRARSLRTKGLSKAALRDNPYAVLLAKLSGVTSPPKARQGFQQFMHENKADVSAAVEEKWRKSSINDDGSANTKRPNAPYRCEVARELFGALPTEEQDAIRARAVAEARQAKLDYAAAMKGGASKSPEARQKCIDGFGRFMAPLMRGLQECTGLQGFIVMGGPMPRFNGAVQTLHLSVGTNLSAVPSTFPGWDKGRWSRNITEFYMEFLRTSYTAEHCAEAALPAPLTLQDARYTIDDGSDEDIDSDDSSSSDSSDSESSSDSEDSDSGGKRKKGKKKRKGEASTKKASGAAAKKKDGGGQKGTAGKRKAEEGADEQETQRKKVKRAKKGAEVPVEESDADRQAREVEARLERGRADRLEREANIERNRKLLDQLKTRQAIEELADAMKSKSAGEEPTKKTAKAKKATAPAPAPTERRRSGRLSTGQEASTGDDATASASRDDDPDLHLGSDSERDLMDFDIPDNPMVVDTLDNPLQIDTANTAGAAWWSPCED
ncbi:hypothetical protein C8R47DRAFT_1208541 [Mycena vitilis]|nr:hypothetical protein C8R47DRAFT_1208541 [Mycena vitilis]